MGLLQLGPLLGRLHGLQAQQRISQGSVGVTAYAETGNKQLSGCAVQSQNCTSRARSCRVRLIHWTKHDISASRIRSMRTLSSSGVLKITWVYSECCISLR